MQLQTLSQAPRAPDPSARTLAPRSSRPAAVGILLVVMGAALAGCSTITAINIPDENPTQELHIIWGLVLALTGLLFVLHAQRKKPEPPMSAAGSAR